MSRKRLTAAVMAACVVAGTADAAVLTQVQGNVLVNTGSGFVPASNGTAVEPGNQVTVQGPGQAVVDFGNGQTVTVPGSSTVVVRAPVGSAASVTPKVVIGSALLAGVVGSIVAISDNDGKKTVWPPISP